MFGWSSRVPQTDYDRVVKNWTEFLDRYDEAEKSLERSRLDCQDLRRDVRLLLDLRLKQEIQAIRSMGADRRRDRDLQAARLAIGLKNRLIADCRSQLAAERTAVRDGIDRLIAFLSELKARSASVPVSVETDRKTDVEPKPIA